MPFLQNNSPTMKDFTSFADAGDYKTLLQQALEI